MDLLNYVGLSEEKKRKLKIQRYLDSLLSDDDKTNNKYKMVSISPLRYAGGKSRAVGYILEHLPENIDNKIVSPFFGGGSFEFALSINLDFEIVGFDIFEILVNYWYYQINKPQELYEELKLLIPDKKNYTRNRHILLNHWEKVKPEALEYITRRKIQLTEEEKTLLDHDDLKRAAYYYYNHQLSYGPMFLGWGSSVYLTQNRYNTILEKVKNFQSGNVTVKCNSFEKVFKRYKKDFIYADPPYYLKGDSKMFKGIYPNSNFAIHHKGFDHELLRNFLRAHEGGFILTYNDCSDIREMYKEYEQYFPTWQYSYGQGETRIGKNRLAKKKVNNIKKSHEIIIVCPPLYS